MSTVPMVAPDGTPGDVPQERVSEAVKAGFKVGAELKAPSGQVGVIPIDRVHDAINAGFMLQGAQVFAPTPQGLDRNIPDANNVADRLTAKYVPAMQLAAGFGGAGKLVGAGAEAVGSPAIRGAVGKAATAVSDVVSPDVTGVISPRLASAQRLLGRLGKALTPAAAATGAEVYRDATRGNAPYAGEEIPDAPDATTENKPYAGERTPPATPPPSPWEVIKQQNLKPGGLRQPVPAQEAPSAALGKIPVLESGKPLPKAAADAIDQVIPPENKSLNMQVKSQVKFYLQKGDLQSASDVITRAASKLPPRSANFIDANTPAVQEGPPEGTAVPQDSGQTLDLLQQSLAKLKRSNRTAGRP